MTDEERNKQYADGLRELADWYEAHPEIDTPTVKLDVYALNTKEDASRCLRALKPCRKEYNGTMFHLSRKFGPIELDFVFYREQVCTAKVVGKRTIEAYTRPAQLIPAEHIAERTEDIIEWECGSILVPEGQGAEDVAADETAAAGELV